MRYCRKPFRKRFCSPTSRRSIVASPAPRLLAPLSRRQSESPARNSSIDPEYEPRQPALGRSPRHTFITAARKTRCVLAEIKWRWTLKVLYAAAPVERNLWAEPGLLNPYIFLSRRRVD